MQDTQVLGAPAATGGRFSNIALWVLQVALAALFAFAGVNKLFGLQQEMVDNFARLGLGVWFRHLVGVLELGGAIALVIPRLCALGALLLAGVMIGAVFTHLFFLPPVAVALVPGTLAAVFLLIARARGARLRR